MDHPHPPLPVPSPGHLVERPLRFVHGGQIVTLPRTNPQRTVLQWLREDARSCGTKEGCAEGDCGACTVIVAELDDDTVPHADHDQAVRSHGLRLRTVNACIRFLPTLEGKALLTVEDLAAEGLLHPAQSALVAEHGSQCGFCTPGFSMTLAALHERHAQAGTQPSTSQCQQALAGNLCRCTGYRPIVTAAQRMFGPEHGGQQPRLALDPTRALLVSLKETHADSLHWPADPDSGAPSYWAPRSLEELAALRQAHPQARLVAGATDVGLWVTKQLKTLPGILWLGEVAELRQIHNRDKGLEIGAAVPLEDAWHALCTHWPSLAEMAQRFAGPPVRHAGTLVGNLANGSPIGDAAPPLMALGARLTLRSGAQTREVPLDGFYLGYMHNQLQPGEFIESVTIPWQTREPGWVVQAHKLSKRFDCDISALSAGFALLLEGEQVADVRLAYGGLAATVKRATATEALLRGKVWSKDLIEAARNTLALDFQPLSDLRASAHYRQRTAHALLMRLWWASRPQGALPPAQWSLSAAMEGLHP